MPLAQARQWPPAVLCKATHPTRRIASFHRHTCLQPKHHNNAPGDLAAATQVLLVMGLLSYITGAVDCSRAAALGKSDARKRALLRCVKFVLIEFYAPWCIGVDATKKLAPILEEVTVTFEKDPDVIITKMDAMTNDVPSEYDVKGYPTLYFSSTSDKVTQYDGDRTSYAIISFINDNKESSSR